MGKAVGSRQLAVGGKSKNKARAKCKISLSALCFSVSLQLCSLTTDSFQHAINNVQLAEKASSTPNAFESSFALFFCTCHCSFFPLSTYYFPLYLSFSLSTYLCKSVSQCGQGFILRNIVRDLHFKALDKA